MLAGTLAAELLRSFDHHPGRPALTVDGATWTYRELEARAKALAATLAEGPDDGPPLTALLARRSPTAYAGVAGIVLRGHGYVPLSPQFPPARTASMLARSGARILVVDGASAGQVPALLAACPAVRRVVLPDLDAPPAWADDLPGIRVATRADLRPAAAFAAPEVPPDAVAYLLFTSGSTGVPKGVMVSHANVVSFLGWARDRYGVGPEDRLTQLFELGFDLSVFDLFVAWSSGACLCAASPADLVAPAAYLLRERPTIWFSVPSLALLMGRLRMLPPGYYPSPRVVLFCGEALPAEVAARFAAAAPNARVENLYGPTELTIACTVYPWDPDRSPAESEDGVVPIGWPFPGLEARVIGPDLREVAPGEVGELAVSGPQVAPGYWEDPERTARAFVVLPGTSARAYRTGDRVRRPVRPEEPLRYLGRVDHQVKVHGHRIELGEIEAALREIAGTPVAVVVPWPVTAAGAEGLVAFLDVPFDERAALAELARRLPDYMVPRSIRRVEAFPLNANGKVDRGALAEALRP